MDIWLAAVSALLLFSLDSVKASNGTSPNSTTAAAAPPPPPCPTSAPSAPLLRFLTVKWGPNCRGSVVLTQLDKNVTQCVCLSSRDRVKSLLSGVCGGRKGCRGDEPLLARGELADGLEISESHLNDRVCQRLIITCEVEEERPPVEPQEPVGFKVATALLCVALILLLLFCLSKPTVRALQKRLSNKRKNRWIGPTQSHSVSYHRGQAVNKNVDGQKHSSYPALDRLVVGNREPSSNRNSYNI